MTGTPARSKKRLLRADSESSGPGCCTLYSLILLTSRIFHARMRLDCTFLYLSFLDLPRTGPDGPNPSRVLPVSTAIQSRDSELSYKWVLFMRVFILGTQHREIKERE